MTKAVKETVAEEVEAVEEVAEEASEATMESESSEEPTVPVHVGPTTVNREALEIALKGFHGSTQASMRFARECAELSIMQFEDHGDLQFVYDFLSAIEKSGKNYVRKAAYISWLAAHAPIAFDKDKKRLVKDKKANATAFNIEKAIAKPFWEFKPDTEVALFTKLDLLRALEGTVKRYENGNKFKAANEATENMLIKAKAAITALAA